MWIWVLSASSRGSLSAIIARAHRYGVTTLYIKSSDGTGMWSQFNPRVVSRLHAGGLDVCAWQFVYGNYPLREAQAGANAVHAGADCLVIDAETQYEGKYQQAQQYVARLRQLIGTSFPVGLTALPYIDYHPGFPYSVFLGPNGATYNLPQMYWRDIGTTVGRVYAHTFTYNGVYQRPIYPLGQVSGSPPASQIKRFRQLATVYHATGVSWWDWQVATLASWRAISSGIGSPSGTPAQATPLLHKGSAGDLVAWAQEHLVSAGESIRIDGGFGTLTRNAVENFQGAHGLTVDGVIGPLTWSALLTYPPASVHWTKRHTTRKTSRMAPLTAASIAAADAGAAARPGATLPEPASALLPDRGNELHGSPGAGRP
jgi:peptidoglycan hydrolase-like protein with peptidoglycan-binding domain